MDTRSNNNGKILGVYNNFHYNPVFKKESDDALLQDELDKRKYICVYAIFTLDALSECKTPFKNYINKYGKQPPAHTSYPTVNYYLNKAAYYSYNFFRTNQPYAVKVLEIIEKAEAKIKDNKEHRIDIFNALKDIKKVYDEMIAEKITTGEVISSIFILFNKFNLHFVNNELHLTVEYLNEKVDQSMQEIETTFEKYPIQYIKGRIHSSYD